MSIAVILSFFAPVKYELPARHFHAVLHTLNARRVPLVVTQAVFPGQAPQPVPSSIPHKVIETESMIFHKDRLWNIGATLTGADKLFFLDADVVFSDSRWLEKGCDLLDTHDVIQPYSDAVWLDDAGMPEMRKLPIARAIARGETPRLRSYHPGFAWGITRSAWNALGGLYDMSAAGNSDALFALSLRDDPGHSEVANWFQKRQDASVICPSYTCYKKNAAGLHMKVGCTEGVTVTHLWHGSLKNRQYVERGRLFPRRPDNEYACHKAENGLLEWDDIEQSNASVFPYWAGKRDDG
jgi:hypothetical protein